MRASEHDRKLKISKLNLTSALLKLTRGEFVHEDLEFRCNEPKYYLESEAFYPSGLDVTPLWESDHTITGFYFDGATPVFVVYCVDGLDEVREVGRSVEDLIGYLVEEYAENEEQVRSVLSSQGVT
ncbi:hypothetical protein [Alcanivorax sp. DP30]|uniref:hypothetical protein n=1 Tax=Alcanivorax sp. DP30 TaxID=2606217 RepID=UPI00136F7977|nr:hypothetical protein [Alcanivorax sp. DP30]MZR62652.1 hypothetical protein [Alcanivorax sp. DP30]